MWERILVSGICAFVGGVLGTLAGYFVSPVVDEVFFGSGDWSFFDALAYSVLVGGILGILGGAFFGWFVMRSGRMGRPDRGRARR